MKGYSANEVFHSRTIDLWRLATRMVDCLPDRPDLRCHEVARAVLRYLPSDGARVVDGVYGHVDHSWIEITNPDPFTGTCQPTILDVYTVGRLPLVALVDLHPLLVHRSIYEKRNPRSDIRGDVVDELARVLADANLCPSAERIR